jgi:hypothetical protein
MSGKWNGDLDLTFQMQYFLVCFIDLALAYWLADAVV